MRATMTMKSMMLCIGAAAAVGFVGRIALLQVGRVRDDESPASLRATTISHQSTDEIFDTAAIDSSDNYYIFLQRFPLQGTFKMLFHTEVVVCPSKAFDQDTVFLNTLNSLLSTLEPSRFERGGGTSVKSTAATAPFAAVPKGQWAKQASPSCVQMGYGGSSCPTSCCGAPHRDKQRGYPLNSQMAVIGNAMGEEKELYLYGTSETISGSDAYKAVCHGHMNAVEIGTLPKCVSDWTGSDYSALTLNCNTFTSTVLKCVYGLSDAKPHLGVSDMVNVKCPVEKTLDGNEVEACLVPSTEEVFPDQNGELSIE